MVEGIKNFNLGVLTEYRYINFLRFLNVNVMLARKASLKLVICNSFFGHNFLHIFCLPML